MIRQKINDDWMVCAGSRTIVEMFKPEDGKANSVSLPHDAMIMEERTENTRNVHQTGFYPGNVYTYIKKLDIPREWEGKSVTLEFEGVANYSRVYINGDYAGGCPNAYSNFYVKAEGFLKFGEKNEIKVVANNMEQTSRWYNGGGIYRNVNLLVGGPVRLEVDGVRITTEEITGLYAAVSVKSELVNSGMSRKKVMLETVLLDAEGNRAACDVVPVTIYPGENAVSHQRMTVEAPKLWDDVNPELYTCRVRVFHFGSSAAEKWITSDAASVDVNSTSRPDEMLDEESILFGIRKIGLSARTGLTVNGREVKLRGSCIHHDNGIIGAVTLGHAEERRCRLLKQAGFNCIRSSHQPISKAMLEACDRLGMYVIDELSDMWTRPKNPNDYAMFFPGHWEQDAEAMVKKDYNHPSVIIYSMGNEIQEAGTASGAGMNRKINNYFKMLDQTRYTTNGINGLMAAMDRMGEIMAQIMGVSKEELAAMQVPKLASEEGGCSQTERREADSTAGQGGADEVNGMLNVMMGPMADALAVSPVLRDMLEEFTSSMDIAGYNYLTALHEAEKEYHPNRVVLGTETFPADIVRLWDIVKRNSHVIGDMTWTGYDYLGEAGCGIFHYDGTQNFSAHWPDRLAYIGDIDLTGYRRPISYLREIVFGLRRDPYIAVIRMNRNGQSALRSAWMWKDNIASWTWPGYEGQEASVDVYADAEEVELFLNGSSQGRKAVYGYVAVYQVPYQAGELKAIGYREGTACGEWKLTTAGDEVVLQVETDRAELASNGADLAYLTISLEDRLGHKNLHAVRTVELCVEGEGSLQGFGSADPQAMTSYGSTVWETCDGRLLAAIRAGRKPGSIRVNVKAQGCAGKTVIIECR